MLDFMIPEPGAFYLDKQTDPDDSATTIIAVPEFKTAPGEINVRHFLKIQPA